MAKLPVKKISLTQCLDIVASMAAVHNTLTDGPVKSRFKLDKDAIENFKIVVTNGENYHVGLEALSPAAKHFVDQAHKRQQLQGVLEQRLFIDKTMAQDRVDEVLKGYDSFSAAGGAHGKFHKHECVDFLIGLVTSAELRKIMLEYPQAPAKRDAWFARNEKVLDEAYKEPMGLRTERLFSKLVHWIYFEQHGNKYEPAKARKEVKETIGTIKPAKPAVKIEEPKMPGDNQLAAAFKKAKLLTEPAVPA